MQNISEDDALSVVENEAQGYGTLYGTCHDDVDDEMHVVPTEKLRVGVHYSICVDHSIGDYGRPAMDSYPQAIGYGHIRSMDLLAKQSAYIG